MTEEARQIIGERDYKIAEVNDNPDLTPEAKQRYISSLNEWAQGEISSIREFEARKIEEEVTTSRRGVYGVPEADRAKSAAEREQIYQSFRSARADVHLSTLNPNEAAEELQGILDEAERTGDATLARAAFHHGLDLGVQQVVDRFLKDKPGEAKNLERYNAALAREAESKSFESSLADGLTDHIFDSV